MSLLPINHGSVDGIRDYSGIRYINKRSRSLIIYCSDKDLNNVIIVYYLCTDLIASLTLLYKRASILLKMARIVA